MTKKRIESIDNPQNLDEMEGKILPIEHYKVAEWHAQRDGKGKPTEVHLLFKLLDVDLRFSLRLKTAQDCDELIAALQKHRKGVWK